MSLVGYTNSGNSCYYNACLQALFNCPSFRDWIVHSAPVSDFHQALQDLLKSDGVSTVNSQSVNPISSLQILQQNSNGRLIRGQQNDAQECLQEIFRQLPVDRCVDGGLNLCNVYYRSIYNCGSCGGSYTADDEPAQQLIDIPLFQSETTTAHFIRRTCRIASDCKCRLCGIAGSVNQSYSLRKSNKIIILLFKRYYQPGVYQYPETLVLTSGGRELIYRVVSQIEQYGTMEAGHYYTRIVKDGRFYLCDDARIIEIVDPLTPNPYSYLVFYHLENE